MYSSLSGVLFKILVDKLSPLVTQNAQHLGTTKGLELSAGCYVVSQLEYLLRCDKSSLVFHRDERNKHNLVFMLDPEISDDKVSFAIQTKVSPRPETTSW